MLSQSQKSSEGKCHGNMVFRAPEVSKEEQEHRTLQLVGTFAPECKGPAIDAAVRKTPAAIQMISTVPIAKRSGTGKPIPVTGSPAVAGQTAPAPPASRAQRRAEGQSPSCPPGRATAPARSPAAALSSSSRPSPPHLHLKERMRMRIHSWHRGSASQRRKR